MNITHRLLLVIALGAGWAQQGSAAVSKTVWPECRASSFLFIENQEDNNLFVAPTDGLDPRLTGANAWTSLKGNGQVSLAYVDNGYNTDINNWNVDMWENGPIRILMSINAASCLVPVVTPIPLRRSTSRTSLMIWVSLVSLGHLPMGTCKIECKFL